jgi:hypothetical protein
MEAAMSSEDTPSTGHEEDSHVTTHAGMDLWRVQLMTGEVRVMSVDALDDAFQAGIITESTPVLPPGATAWTRLADAAGLDDASSGSSGSSGSHESNVPSLAPMAVSLSESTGNATPYGARADHSLPDLDLDALEDEAFKPKRGRVFAVIGLAALFVGGLGFAATRVGNIADAAKSSLSAPKAAAVAPPPAAVDLNEAAPGKTLTEEQKAKLAEADKARAVAAAAREAQRQKDRPSAPAKRGPREKTTTPFVNGGNKYDPLNGAL